MAYRITRVYTRTGDDGTTGLVSGLRVSKSDLRIDAMGKVDEIAAQLGAARCELKDEHVNFRDVRRAQQLDQLLEFLGNKLFTAGGDLATPIADRFAGMPVLQHEDVLFLERACDAWNETLAPLKDFVLPGGTRTGAALHGARVLARSAERSVVALMQSQEISPFVVRFVNRLSDLLFILARCAIVDQGAAEYIWRRDLPEPEMPASGE